jgi:hypothetical protein
MIEQGAFGGGHHPTRWAPLGDQGLEGTITRTFLLRLEVLAGVEVSESEVWDAYVRERINRVNGLVRQVIEPAETLRVQKDAEIRALRERVLRFEQSMRLTSEEETGAEHCQHDNPTLGQELMIDWLADVFKIDQRKLSFFPG